MKKFLPDMPLWLFDTVLVVGCIAVAISFTMAVKKHIELLETYDRVSMEQMIELNKERGFKTTIHKGEF